MATNFRTIIHRVSDTLHLELEGDFDGTSALELVNILVENCGLSGRVMIHTNGLNTVHPFGKAVFERNLPGHVKLKSSIVFIGEHAEEMAPFSEQSASFIAHES